MTAIPQIVSAEEWQQARDDLLKAEKDATRALDALAARRRRLPMVRFDASKYAFDTPDGAALQVHLVPLPGPRPRARKEIIVPGGHHSSPQRINHALILSTARAKSWMRDLRSGKYADTAEIARQFQLNEVHVRRILRFGYLAPDVVETIVDGRQPRSMTVRRLLQGVP